jgi:hypothetical protein
VELRKFARGNRSKIGALAKALAADRENPTWGASFTFPQLAPDIPLRHPIKRPIPRRFQVPARHQQGPHRGAWITMLVDGFIDGGVEIVIGFDSGVRHLGAPKCSLYVLVYS